MSQKLTGNAPVVNLPEARRGVALPSRRMVGERSFARTVRFHRLARNDKRLRGAVGGLHFLACPMLHHPITIAAQDPLQAPTSSVCPPAQVTNRPAYMNGWPSTSMLPPRRRSQWTAEESRLLMSE